MSIPYTYTVLNVDIGARTMEVLYESPGHESMHIGTRIPFEGEDIDAVIDQYAPTALWESKVTPVQDVQVGRTGSLTLPEPVVMTLELAKQLKRQEIAEWRWTREVSGVTLNGTRIATDRESQALITGAYVSLKDGLRTSVDFKTASGTWIQLGIDEITPIAVAVSAHVQQCFSLEKMYSDMVTSATTIEEVQLVIPEPVFEL